MSVSRNNMNKYFTFYSELMMESFEKKCNENNSDNLSVSNAIDMLRSLKEETILSAVNHFEKKSNSSRVKSSKATSKKKTETTPKDDAEANAKAELVASLQEELATLTGKTGLEISETSIVKLRKQIQSAKVEINRAKRAAEKEKKDLERARVKAEKDAEKARVKAEKAKAKAEKDAEKARVKAEKARVKAEKAKAKAEKDAEKARVKAEKDAEKAKKEVVPKVSKKAQKIAELKNELATIKGVSVESLTVEDKVLKIREAIKEAKKANASDDDKPKKEKKATKASAPKPNKRLIAKKEYITNNIPEPYRKIFDTDEKINAAKMAQLKVYSTNIKLYKQCIDMEIRSVDGTELTLPHESSPKYYRKAISNKLREE